MITCDKCGNDIPTNFVGDFAWIQCNYCGEFVQISYIDDDEERN